MTSDTSTTVDRAAGATQVRRGGRSAPRHGCQPSGIFGLAILLAILVMLCAGCGGGGVVYEPRAICAPHGGVKSVQIGALGRKEYILCSDGEYVEQEH